MSFSKEQLVTGDLIKVKTKYNGEQYGRVYLRTENGDIVSGDTWFPLGSYSDYNLFEGGVELMQILEVWRPVSNSHFRLTTPNESTHKLLWLRSDKVKVEARAELKELEQQLKELRTRARELNAIINDGKM